MKKGIFILVLFVLAGCAINTPTVDAPNAPLATTTGGYLSSDTANDITPFVYHDTNTDKSYLFFSSDRDGSYDIYYAEMTDDDKFLSPVKMGTNINTTTNDETCPIVFDQDGKRVLFTLTTNTMLLSADSLDDSLKFVSNEAGIECTYTSLGLQVSEGWHYLVASDGTTNIQTYEFNIGDGFYPMSTLSYESEISSINIYSLSNNVELYEFNLYHTTSGDKAQIGLAIVLNKTAAITLTNALIPDYASTYNDAYPFVDTADMRVYFASDRYGNGNYDLYRYNTTLFTNVIEGLIPAIETNTNVIDTTPPTPGGLGVISFVPIATGVGTVSWTKATDLSNITVQSNLQYKVVYRMDIIPLTNLSELIPTITDTNILTAIDWTIDINTCSISNLNNMDLLTINILVKDEAENSSLYISTNVDFYW